MRIAGAGAGSIGWKMPNPMAVGDRCGLSVYSYTSLADRGNVVKAQLTSIGTIAAALAKAPPALVPPGSIDGRCIDVYVRSEQEE
jgi:hypothetical protein